MKSYTYTFGSPLPEEPAKAEAAAHEAESKDGIEGYVNAYKVGWLAGVCERATPVTIAIRVCGCGQYLGREEWIGKRALDGVAVAETTGICEKCDPGLGSPLVYLVEEREDPVDDFEEVSA